MIAPTETLSWRTCAPQANLSEIVLGGNGAGAAQLQKLIASKSRKTIGGYFDSRIASPHKVTNTENSYLIRAKDYNANVPKNVWLG
jgi:chromosome partitioning protein